MSRRTHKKSRNGCTECKRRHIKCDESRPACRNCSIAQMHCSFIDTPLPFTQSEPTTTVTYSTTSPETPSTIDSTNHGQNGEQPLADFGANIDHLEYLCNFCSEIWKDFQVEPTTIDASFRAVRKYAFSAPYLMHEILALGALHLGISRPERRAFYQRQAAGLQTHALSLFNNAHLDVNADNCVPLFLFSSFLSFHVLCDTLRHRDDDSSGFLEKFTNYLHLHRGVRAITGKSWHFLRGTELGPMIQASESIPRSEEGLGSECKELKVFIESVDLGPNSIKAYQQAIQHLQWVFDADNSPAGKGGHMVFAWPVLAPAEYTDLLAERRPEALIILAYYGVLLHRHRTSWIVGDGGQFLIETITKNLGSHWNRWLAWPNAALEYNSPIGMQSNR